MTQDTPEENSTTPSGSSEDELSALDSDIDDMLAAMGAKVVLSAEDSKKLEELDSLIDDW